MKKIIMGILTALLLAGPAFAEDKIRITATTSTFASLTEEVTGDLAEIYYVASPNQNIHFIEPTPKDVLKIRKAAVFVHGGLDLEIWRDPLLQAAGRGDFISGDHAVDLSESIPLIDAPGHDHPPDHFSRLHGDVHVFGNPHYWADPENAKIIVSTLAAKLGAFYPEYQKEFEAGAEDFKKRLDAAMTDWRGRMAPYQGSKVVTYHNSWPYLLRAFGLEAVDFLEPLPGIPPTAKHLKHVMDEIQAHKVKIIIREAYEEKNAPQKVAEKTGAAVVTLFLEAGQTGGSYINLIENNVKELEKALSA
jgi:zinc/manganese transport system substrate-binding protein